MAIKVASSTGLGTDTNWFRSAADTVKTNDSLIVAGGSGLQVTGGDTTLSGSAFQIQSNGAVIRMGSSVDTTITRAAAGVIQPDIFRMKSGNVQTTVGAAGGASALPATPTKYFKFQDSDGTVLVVPAYAAS